MNETAQGADGNVFDDGETYSFTVRQSMKASPHDVYRGWTTAVDSWFGSPGTAAGRTIPGEPFFFDVRYDGASHPHYGRYLELSPDRHVRMTWVTGRGGTEGAETTLDLLLSRESNGTDILLQHSGFMSRASAEASMRSWPVVLAHLDDRAPHFAPEA